MKLASALLVSAVLSPFACAQTTVTRASFGSTADGKPVDVYTLKDHALEIRITNFGAHIIAVLAPDRNGKVADVVLGYDTQAGYDADRKTYMGSVPGRYANRIANAQFTLDGKTYHLPANNGPNTLHGGTEGFDRKIWTARQVPDGVELTLVSPDGDQGFPGTLTAHVKYTLSGDRLRIEYSATTDKPTVLNLTNHTYFNLAGHGDILGDIVTIHASRFTPTDKTLIPTGELAPVAGTPFDFETPHVIGERIHTDNPQLNGAKGYDHNFVLDGPHDLTHPAATVLDPGSGRMLTVYTTQPGVQFYTGNSLDGSTTGHDGMNYAQYDGLCLETQHFPDSPNHPAFPTTTLNPGQTFHSTTVFQFSVKK